MSPDEQAPSLKSIQTTANAPASNVLASSRKHGRYDAYVAMLAAAVISQKATTPTLEAISYHCWPRFPAIVKVK